MGVSGFLVSLISGQIRCSKINAGESAKQGFSSALAPTVVYLLASYFVVVRKPFASTIHSFGMAVDTSVVLGVGYLIMLAAWISTVSNIHRTEKVVCNPDVAEMTKFKEKLMADLARKQALKENQS